MSNFKITRTIHPVGQGAFYSEVLKIDDIVLKTVVYDCGTTTKGKYLNNEIKNLFANNSNKPIDLLFISHFHEDHINGIPDLIKSKKVNKIIIPNITLNLFIIEYLYNLFNAKKSTLEFMERCASVLFEDNKDSLIETRKESYPISDSNNKILWKYIIPKIETNINKREKFLMELFKLLPNMPKYSDIIEEVNKLKNNQNAYNNIKSIYNSIYKKDHNSYSMLVLSTKGDDVKGDNLACLYTGMLKSVNMKSLLMQ